MSFREYARALRRHWSLHASSTPEDAGPGLVVVRRAVSTHLLARRIVAEYGGEGHVAPPSDLLAWGQTAGVGRGGKCWSSPPGMGVYATLIRPLRRGPAVQELPLLVAAALCDSVNLHLGGRCRLKWPNDLLVAGRKLGGILIDTISRGEDGPTAIISFGVNHGVGIEEPRATSMELEAPGRTAMADLAVELVAAVDSAMERRGGVGDTLGRYRRLSLHQPGETLRCRCDGEELAGVFRGFDRHGFLRLDVDGREHLLRAGEVTADES